MPSPIAAARARPGSRAFRLTGQGAFEAVFRQGRRFEGKYVQLVAAPAGTRPGRTGYVIGRKVSTRAVDRNRIRRKLREVMRPLRPALADYDLIVRVKRASNRVEQDAAAREAQALLAALTGGARP